MKVNELVSKINAFLADLEEHADLWMKSLDHHFPDYPLINADTLQEQRKGLARQLGLLRPYLDRFHLSTIMTMAGVQWDVYDSAISNDLALRKGPSVEEVVQQLQQILGRMDSMNPDDEFTFDARPSPQIKLSPQQVTIYNLQGAQARVNIQSNDHSTNVSSVTEEQLFDGMRKAFNQGVSDESQLKELSAKLDELEAAKHTGTFLSKYQSFMNLAAAHVNLIAPFLPALAQLIGKT